MNITEAAYAANPYPFYTQLREQGSFYRDASGLVIATDALAVRTVLSELTAVVRPPREPIPKTVINTVAGEIFGRLIRMTEGVARDPMRQAMIKTLEHIPPDVFRQEAHRLAHKNIEKRNGLCDPMELAFSIPVSVMAHQIGFGIEQCDHIRHQIELFVSCINPLSKPESITASIVATKILIDHVQNLLQQSTNTGIASQMESLRKQTNTFDQQIMIANLIGMMSQTFEATAALIGQGLGALARHRGVWDDQPNDIKILDQVLCETLRHDAPIQNTRRFITTDIEMAKIGIAKDFQLRSGDTILVLLASANRDQQVYTHPDQFDITRKTQSNFSFSSGRHRCPGEMFARAMAAGVIHALREAGFVPATHVDTEPSYVVSANARIPMLKPVQL